VEPEEQEELYYLGDVMVACSGSGFKVSGERVDVVDVADSIKWLKAMHKVGTREEYQTIWGVIQTDEVESSPVVATDEVVAETLSEEVVVAPEAAALIDKAKEVLTKGKKRIAELAGECATTEAVLEPLLTKENGFFRNQQAWYSILVAPV
jgi:hypothetical protein